MRIKRLYKLQRPAGKVILTYEKLRLKFHFKSLTILENRCASQCISNAKLSVL